MAGNRASISRAARRAIASSGPVQREINRKAHLGKAAFRAAAKRRTGRFAHNVKVKDTRSAAGLPGKRIVAYPDSPASKNPNAPVSIEYGARGRRGAHAMTAARAAVRR